MTQPNTALWLALAIGLVLLHRQLCQPEPVLIDSPEGSRPQWKSFSCLCLTSNHFPATRA